MKGKLDIKRNLIRICKYKGTIKLVTLVMDGEFGSIVLTNPLGNFLNLM
jgi:hypothetical protein